MPAIHYLKETKFSCFQPKTSEYAIVTVQCFNVKSLCGTQVTIWPQICLTHSCLEFPLKMLPGSRLLLTVD